MQNIAIHHLIHEAEELEARARIVRERAGSEKMDRIKAGEIDEWLDVQFESSSGLTDQFALFAKQYKKAIVKAMGDYELVNFSRGHFYMSGFFRSPHAGKLVYFSTDDVRGSKGWYNNILIRTAQHEKDYTGGRNCFSSLENMRDRADDLTA